MARPPIVRRESPPPRAGKKKRRARSSEASEERTVPRLDYLEALIEAVPDGVILFGRDGELLAVNGGFTELCGVQVQAHARKQPLARGYESQKREARIGCNVLNRMAELGKPESQAIVGE